MVPVVILVYRARLFYKKEVETQGQRVEVTNLGMCSMFLVLNQIYVFQYSCIGIYAHT